MSLIDMTETPEEIALFFENQMRKGFLSIITLHIINKQPCHGYKIMQEVKERTNNVWSPPMPTIYWTLGKLKEKGLIEPGRVIETGRRQSKEYVITDLGKQTLNHAADKLKNILKSMRGILISIFGLDASMEPEGMFWD